MSGEGRERDAPPELLAPRGAVGAEPVEPSAALRARVLASARPETRFAGFEARLAALLDLPPEAVRALTARIAAAGDDPWVDDRVPGVRLLHFAGGPRHAAAHCGIVHVAPGVRYPAHRHEGEEWCLVLAGAAEEEGTGRRLAAGDLDVQPPGSAHAYRAAGDAPFVFAVVLTGDITFV
jgi:quercetin dioxygenase-like cupin family protein